MWTVLTSRETMQTATPTPIAREDSQEDVEIAQPRRVKLTALPAVIVQPIAAWKVVQGPAELEVSVS